MVLGQSPKGDKDDFLNWLQHDIESFNSEQQPASSHIQANLALARLAKLSGSETLNSEALYKRALQVASQKTNLLFHRYLFLYAKEINDLNLAAEIAKAASKAKTTGDSLQNQLAILQYKAGDKNAIADYPSGKQTFFSAMSLARMHIELGEFHLAEQLATDIEITEENDPLDVTGLILKQIAQALQRQGKKPQAIEFIDRAYDVAGKQFYTGFGIEATYLAMHGSLVENAERLAKRAVAYRGFHARELTQALIRELVEYGALDKAFEMTRFLTEREEVDQSIGGIALAHAKRGDDVKAQQVLEIIKTSSAKYQAQIALASFYLIDGRAELAQTHANSTLTEMQRDRETELGYESLLMCRLQLGLRNYTVAKQLIDQAEGKYKIKILVAAVKEMTR